MGRRRCNRKNDKRRHKTSAYLTYRLLILSSYLKKQVYIIFMIRHEVIYVGKYQRKKRVTSISVDNHATKTKFPAEICGISFEMCTELMSLLLECRKSKALAHLQQGTQTL
jgi:hypothetical protein